MQVNKILGVVIVLLLVVVNWLSFHDIFEQHTLREWLTLLASILIFFYFIKELKK
ncbi:MAG TPA: hypothetical protein VFA93_02940 [Patescibacteria group bacterium]|nr:hypothetical protein [Patescibacteria group bacterium]